MTENEIKKPDLRIDKTGNTYKILEVTAEADSVMPPHLSTKEAVVIVREGNAMLEIDGRIIYLAPNDVFIIPSATVHTLSVKNKFKAIIIMELDSRIEFVN